MTYDEKIRLIREIDRLACDANGLWCSLESLKRQTAEAIGVTPAALKKANIWQPEGGLK